MQISLSTELRCYCCGESDSIGCSCSIDGAVAPQHQRFVVAKLAQAMAACDCVDNIRVARDGDMDQMADYARRFHEGCCGFYDTFEIHPDGSVYLIGFNHGH